VYPFHHLLLTDSPLSTRFAGLEARRARFLRGLAEDPPAVILVGTADRNAFEPEDSDRQMVRFAELRQFVARRYAEARPVARFRVFVLRPEDAADDPATGVGQAPREPNPQEALEASASPASRWGSGRR
jgi:hypothetical protein